MKITLTEKDNIAEVHLEWPACNELSRGFLSDFEQIMDHLEDESDCRLIVFSGLESQESQVSSSYPDLDHCNKWEKALRRLEKLRLASVACINGQCNYFHFQLILACDYRVATSQSSFQMPEIQKGYLPGMGLFRLAKYIGLGVARRFAFTGSHISASDAVKHGLLDVQCEVSQMGGILQELQTSLSSLDSEALQNARRLLNESFSTPYEQAIGHFLAAQNLCLTS